MYECVCVCHGRCCEQVCYSYGNRRAMRHPQAYFIDIDFFVRNMTSTLCTLVIWRMLTWSKGPKSTVL